MVVVVYVCGWAACLWWCGLWLGGRAGMYCVVWVWWVVWWVAWAGVGERVGVWGRWGWHVVCSVGLVGGMVGRWKVVGVWGG